MRTQEEILAQCEARYRELERRAEAIKKLEAQPKCVDCRWAESRYLGHICNQPLIKGFDERGPNCFDRTSYSKHHTALCGPEKALWEPKRSMPRRLLDWWLGTAERLVKIIWH